MDRIYLDHAATTPPDPRVLDAMQEVYRRFWGNPSSIYLEGQHAERALNGARRAVAGLLDVPDGEILFTSGGTESDNAAIRGAAFGARARTGGNHIVTSQIEHHAVLHAVEQLESEGFRVTYLPVDGEGFLRLDALAEAVGPDTIVVSIMLANNEVGTIQPIEDCVRVVRERNPDVVVHTDAVQAAGDLDIGPASLGVDLLSLAGHKFYGPRGVGVLWVRTPTPWRPLIVGGGQENDRRAGTENVAAAVGFATAMKLAWDEREGRANHAARLRDRLLAGVPERVSDTFVTGPLEGSRRLSNNFSCCFRDVEGESVLLALDLAGVAASSGSACTTGSLEPSHVLTAMGIDPDLAHSSLRLTVGKDTTEAQIDRVLEILPEIVARLRELSGN